MNGPWRWATTCDKVCPARHHTSLFLPVLWAELTETPARGWKPLIFFIGRSSLQRDQRQQSAPFSICWTTRHSKVRLSAYWGAIFEQWNHQTPFWSVFYVRGSKFWLPGLDCAVNWQTPDTEESVEQRGKRDVTAQRGGGWGDSPSLLLLKRRHSSVLSLKILEVHKG